MNRRTFLGSAGAVGSLAVIGYASRARGDTLRIRFWRSERAARYPSVPDRIREVLAVSLDLPFWSLSVSDGGVVSVGTEDGARATTHGGWPATLLVGGLGRDGVDPVPDVNLLVTDGRMDVAPTGYGVPHVASVGGARHLAELDPVDPGIGTVPIGRGPFAAQVLVHEVGHALGLRHRDGEAVRRGDAVVVSPMLSAYAWDPTYDGARCGGRDLGAVEEPTLERRLSYRFSRCARERLRRYGGRYVP